MPARPFSPSELSLIAPPPACLTRFEANSVVTRAICSHSTSVNPIAAAYFRPASPARVMPAGCVTCTWMGSPFIVLTSAPFPDRNGGALVGRGLDVHFIHQPFCAGQTHPQAITGSIALLQGHFHVGNAGAMVGELNFEARQGFVLQTAPAHNPGAGVLDYVARQLRGCRDDAGHIGRAKSRLARRLPHRATGQDNVSFALESNLALRRAHGFRNGFRTWRGLTARSSARSTLRAVSILPSESPISVAVTATAGRIPEIIVRPPINATICAVSVTVRAKKESRVSTCEMSSTTALASCFCIACRTLSWSAETVGSSGSAGKVTMRMSLTLMTEMLSLMHNLNSSGRHSN